MDGEHRITLTIEGLARERGYPRLLDFVSELQLLSSSLKKTEELISGGQLRRSYYRVVELRLSSPATVVLEALPVSQEADVREAVLREYFTLLEAVQNARDMPHLVSTSLLRDLQQMAEPVGKRLASVAVSYGERVVRFTQELKAKIELVLAPEETAPGSVRGMLEAINIHSDANVFSIYPDFGPAKVTCHFPRDLRETAISALGRFVEVRGVLKWKTTAPYPHEIDVKEIEALPDETELPRLSDLLGVAPDATGDLSSEEFIRRLRDAAQ